MHTFGPIIQNGYVVADAEAAARAWVEYMGVGPFYLLDHIRIENYAYRGTAAHIDLRIAMGVWGGTQIELIQPLGGCDILYRDHLRDSPGTINHYATFVSDLDTLIATHRLEARVIQSGQMPNGLKFVYLDRYTPDGLHLELIQPQQHTLTGFEGMKAIARQWDGKNALRPISAMGPDIASVS